MGRAPCCDKANVKKGPWSPEEDTKLKEFIDKYGTGGNWIALPHKAGLKRCGKSCRLRWLNYLRPNIKHGEFSDDEDRIICSLFASIGSRWSIIAAQLPGRTDNDIKNYWNTKLKKKLLGIAPSQRKPNRQPQSQLLFPSPPSSSSPSQAGFFTSATTPKPLVTGLEGSSFSALSQDPFLMSAAVSTITITSAGLLEGASPYNPYQMKESNCNMIMFGGDQQSCCSSDGSCTQISYGKELDYDFVSRQGNGGGGEQMGFESYLFGAGAEDCSHKLLLAEGGGMQQQAERRNVWSCEAPLEYNYEEIKQLLMSSSSNSGCNNSNSNSNSLYLDDPTGSGSREGFANQGRVVYEF